MNHENKTGRGYINLRRDISDEEIIIKLQAGQKGVEISKVFGFNANTIRNRAKAAGWQFTWGGVKKADRDANREINAKRKETQKNRRLCSCCGINFVPDRPVYRSNGGPGVKLHRLCFHCWKYGEERIDGVDW